MKLVERVMLGLNTVLAWAAAMGVVLFLFLGIVASQTPGAPTATMLGLAWLHALVCAWCGFSAKAIDDAGQR